MMTIGGTRTAMAKRSLYGRNNSSEEDDDDASFDTVLVPAAGKKGLNALFKYSARDEDTLEINYKRSDSASLMTSETEGEIADEVSLGNEQNLKLYNPGDGIIVVRDTKPTPTIAFSLRRKLRKSMRFVKKQAGKLLDRKRHAKDAKDHTALEVCVNHDSEGNPRTTD